MNVDGRTIHNYTYVQPTITENRDVVQIVNAPEVRRTL